MSRRTRLKKKYKRPSRKRSPILKLPLEVRHVIFGLLIQTHRICSTPLTENEFALLQVNRQLRDEIYEWFSKGCKIIYPSSNAFTGAVVRGYDRNRLMKGITQVTVDFNRVGNLHSVDMIKSFHTWFMRKQVCPDSETTKICGVVSRAVQPVCLTFVRNAEKMALRRFTIRIFAKLPYCAFAGTALSTAERHSCNDDYMYQWAEHLSELRTFLPVGLTDCGIYTVIIYGKTKRLMYEFSNGANGLTPLSRLEYYREKGDGGLFAGGSSGIIV